jgi:CheY-like chemotaxis protein
MTCTSPSEPVGMARGNAARRSHVATVQKVAIVNGNPEALSLIEDALGHHRYDVVFIESVAHAYSHIKRLQPHLIIVCVRLEQPEGFQVLSMLALDKDTRQIPVLTYTPQFEGGESDDEEPEDEEESGSEVAIFQLPSAPRMN